MQQHWRESLTIFLVLLFGFLFYTLYGSWSQAAASFEQVDGAPVRLPADVLLQIEHSAAQMAEPDLSAGQFLSESYLEQRFVQHELWDRRMPRALRPDKPPSPVGESVAGVSIEVMSAAGTATLWGLPEIPSQLCESLPLREGRWPDDAGEIGVHRKFAAAAGLRVGDETEVLALQSPQNRISRATVRVVGLFGGAHDVYPQMMSTSQMSSQLAGSRSNLALLWSREVEPVEVESPMSPDPTVYQMPQLVDLFEGFRWGTRAPAVGEFDDTTDLHHNAVRAGKTVPYGTLVEGRARIDGEEEVGLPGMYAGLGARLAPVTLMIFLSQAVALTVILAIVVVDRQRTLGAYKVMGLAPGQVWKMYFLQVLVTGVAAGLAGLALFSATAGVFGDFLGFALRLPAMSVGLWGAAVVGLSVWCGHLASSLFDTTEVDSLLREAYDFDWWSLVRLTGLSSHQRELG